MWRNFTSGSRARLKKWPTNGGKTPEAEKAFKGLDQESYRNTEQDIIALPPGPNTLQLLEVVTSKHNASE